MNPQTSIVLEQLMSLQNQLQNARGNGANAKVEFEDLEDMAMWIEAAINLIKEPHGN